ncbi:MAG: hypothetical protein D6767_04470 [Candidatus Hydrogenedentota bacterium]|nr:MAG: hypothetical protein D6767_04470 [Candidatus Hydrogenedentota bacterium]
MGKKLTLLFSFFLLTFFSHLFRKFTSDKSFATLYAQVWDDSETEDDKIARELRESKIQRDWDHPSIPSADLIPEEEKSAEDIYAEEMMWADPYDFEYSPSHFHRYQELENYTDPGEIPKEFRDRPHPFYVNTDTVKLRIYGNTDIKMVYGKTFAVSDIDREPGKTPTSDQVANDFETKLNMKVNIKGKIGKKITVNVDFSKDENQKDQSFYIQYKAIRRREFVREITLGNIDLKFPYSEYAVFERKSKKTIGVEGKFRRGKLKFHTIATLTQGQSAVTQFTGNRQSTSALIKDFQYARRKYYQIEPFIYYDSGFSGALISNPDSAAECPPTALKSTSPPASLFDRTSPTAYKTFTSAYSDPASFQPNAAAVQIDISSVELWLDDGNPTNNTTATQKISANGTDLGMYDLLVQGKDYTINAQGNLVLLRGIGDEAKMYIRYTRKGGSTFTCDPSAQVVNGKIETFIKWNTAMQEILLQDTNGDGVYDSTTYSKIIDDDPGAGTPNVNYDIYEVRGVYLLGATQIEQAGFQVSLQDKSLNNTSLLSSLGQYTLNAVAGEVLFYLREPFKSLKKDSTNYAYSLTDIEKIYAERQPSDVQDYLQHYLRFDFQNQVRSYRLNHFNIIKGSVEVKVDDRVIDPSQYYVDYNSGYFAFYDPDSIPITPSSKIEISYEYTPFGGGQKGFIVGLRSEYQANRSVKLGSTVLWNGQFEPTEAPRIGEEPGSKIVLGTDLTLKFSEEKLTKLVNAFPGADFDLLPVKFEGFAEYARSFFNRNTYGIALIDDMESSEEVEELSINDKDWTLGSVPQIVIGSSGVATIDAQCARSPLYYRYYRDPADVTKGLFGPSFNASPLPYSEISGPYMIADGHLDPSQLETAEQQESLVLEFDYSKANTVAGIPKFASIVSSAGSAVGRDFSGLTYLEFNAKLEELTAGTLTNGIKIYIEFGDINEDSDDDGTLDLEDIGLDGKLGDTNQNGQLDPGENWDTGEGDKTITQNRSTGQTEDKGYIFNPPNCPASFQTVVGNGPNISGYPSTRGNGNLDTEDLNFSNTLNTTDNVIILGGDDPSLTYQSYELGPSVIKPGDWQHVRILINKSALTAAQQALLKSVKAYRLVIVPASGSESGHGRLFIDSIQFGGSKWRSPRGKLSSQTVESDVSNPFAIRAAVIDNFTSKAEYGSESFLNQEKDLWQDIHGKKTSTELARIREAALKILYNFQPSVSESYSSLFLTRTSLTSMDLRYYRKFVFWVNFRPSALANPNQVLVFRLGSSDTDYYQYTYPVQGSGWQKVELNLEKPEHVSGRPSLKYISQFMIGFEVTSSAGIINNTSEVWINEMYVSDPAIQTDDAYKYEGTVRITKPLFETEAGTPILSDIKFTYRRKHRGKRFSSVGQTSSNTSEDKTEFLASSKVLPFWDANYSYSLTTTETDNDEREILLAKLGKTSTLEHSTSHKFHFKSPYVPVISVGYKYRKYDNTRVQALSTGTVTQDQETITNEVSHAPTLTVNESFPELFKKKPVAMKITYKFKTAHRFFKRRETTITYPDPANILPGQTDFDGEKEQTDDTENQLTYSIGKFSMSPSYSYKQKRLLQRIQPDNEVLTTIDSDYYFPYLDTPDDFRYRQRITRYSLRLSYRDLFFTSPEWNMTAVYQENSFQDNSTRVTQPIWNRWKQPSTTTTTDFSLPITPEKISKKLKFIRSIRPSFRREISLSETQLPFTAKDGLYDDKLGVRRTLPPLMDRTYNFWKYPFWHSFLSDSRRPRNNFSNARDYVYKTSFKPTEADSNPDAFSFYNNSLNLKDSIDTTAEWDIYRPLTLRTNWRLAQNASRSAIGGLPVQDGYWSYSILQTWDLMQILDFWFWANKKHRSTWRLDYTFTQTKRITENKLEDRYNPSTALYFQWIGADRTSNTFEFGISLGITDTSKEDYISDTPEEDNLIFQNISQTNLNKIRAIDYDWEFYTEYTTELLWLKRQLENLTGLSLRYKPRYKARLSLKLNRYFRESEYTQALQPRDIYTLLQRIDSNLHPNVRGSFDMKWVYEIHRNAQDDSEKRRLISFEIGIGARILF